MNRLVLIVCAFVVVLLGSACQREPEWMASYKECQEKMGKEIEKMRSSVPDDIKDSPFGESMAGLTTGMAEGLTTAVCEVIKQVCEKDPKGQECQAITKAKW